MPPMITVRQSGEVVVDFMPVLEESTDEISLKGKRNGEEITVTRKEWHPVVTGYNLGHFYHKRGARWEIQKTDRALFWEVFDYQWQEAPFVDISPGLIVRIFLMEYQGIRHSAQGATWWEDRSGFGEETLAKLQLLKCSENQEQFRALMKQLGVHLRTMCMLENFVEWTIMGLEAGQRPFLKMPYPELTKEDVLEIARGTKGDLEVSLTEGLRNLQEETRAVIAYIDGLERRGFNPRRTLAKLIYLCRGLWPRYSMVHDGISSWFIKKVYKELKAAVSS